MPADHGASLIWDDGAIVTVDQRQLPARQVVLRITTVDEAIDAITSLAVRGAPAIGLCGAFATALSAAGHLAPGGAGPSAVLADADRISRARPTAANLAWAVQRAARRIPDGPGAVLEEAFAMLAEDTAVNKEAVNRTTALVAELCPRPELRILTHCNTGRLATSAVGTALGAILQLAAERRVHEVLVGETRPLLQGTRLTAWELGEAGVPYRLCTDSAGPAAIAAGMVDCVIVGADRVTTRGDVANKIGTYSLAVAAARHHVPFIVVAPEASWDPELTDGSGIVIEERDPAEVTHLGGVRIAPPGARAYNPAFDVTPAELVTAIVTERRVLRPTQSPPPAEGGDRGRLGAELAAMSGALYACGWMPGTAGNLSARLPRSDRALITPSGRSKGSLTPKSMVEVVAVTGAAVRADGPRPSAETAIHAAVYRHTTAGAVVHVHSPYATAVAIRNAGAGGPGHVRLEDYELLKGLGLADPRSATFPVFANWPRVPLIADEVAAYLRTAPPDVCGLLIADHGITVWGDDLAQARNRLECLEAIFQLSLLTTVGLTPAL